MTDHAIHVQVPQLQNVYLATVVPCSQQIIHAQVVAGTEITQVIVFVLPVLLVVKHVLQQLYAHHVKM